MRLGGSGMRCDANQSFIAFTTYIYEKKKEENERRLSLLYQKLFFSFLSLYTARRSTK